MNFVTAIKRISMFAIAALIAVQAMAVTEAQHDAIAERLKPVGEVCLQGDKSCAGVVVASADAAPKSAADIYSGTCAGCHDTGAAGAPKVGNAGDWAARIGQGKATLYKHAIGGLNSMPPKGLCMDCSDDDIKAVVDLMVSRSK